MKQTGRTTRMLREARRLAKEGRAVYVVAADNHHARQLRRALKEEFSISVETVDSLGNLHWESMSLLGAHPNCVVLVDHYAIEKRYWKVLEMLHRFDEEPKL